jgi:hypothetical protein
VVPFYADCSRDVAPRSVKYQGKWADSGVSSAVPATVVAQERDTLRLIAARVFGDANLW